jgi:hypothetical protein
MLRKIYLATTLILFVLLFSSYTWIRYGPGGIKANRVCFYLFDDGIICVDSGMYLVEGMWDTIGEYISFPALGAAELNEDTILLIHSDGSYSDGIYSFDLQTHQYSLIEYCHKPQFIVNTGSGGKYYVGYEYGLLKSSDGKDWIEIQYFKGQSCIDFAFEGTHLAVATSNFSDNVFYSEDLGTIWEPISGDFQISQIEFVRYYGNTLAGICNEDDMYDGFYLYEDEEWNVSWYLYDIIALGIDNMGNPFLGWPGEGATYEGISRYHLPPTHLEFFNEGLPDLNIHYINTTPGFLGNNIIFCCNDSGVFYSYDFAVNLEILVQNKFDVKIFPNPFTTSTTISFRLSKPENVQFTVYNVQSQIVYSMQERQDKGEHKLEWNAEGLPSGMYYFTISDNSGRIGSGKLLKTK